MELFQDQRVGPVDNDDTKKHVSFTGGKRSSSSLTDEEAEVERGSYLTQVHTPGHSERRLSPAG